MNAMTRNALSVYNKVEVETGVIAASPQKLILMLFEGAQLAAREATQHMLRNEIAQKGAAISKTIMIIEHGLKASLDIKAGGEMALKLQALYDYMINRLLIANLKNQPEALDEVARLLAELHDAWAAIGTANISHITATAAQPQPADRPAASYGMA